METNIITMKHTNNRYYFPSMQLDNLNHVIKSLLLISLSLVLLLAIGCSPKASDSDAGRETQEDGFRVKAFTTVSITAVDKETQAMIEKEIKSFSSSGTMTINGVEEEKFFNKDESQMISIIKKYDKVAEIKLEGLSSFTKEITDRIEDKKTVATVEQINAKKKFGENANDAKSICLAVIERNGLESKKSSEFNDDKTEEFKGGGKRVVINTNDGFVTVIAEGSKEFVDNFREEFKGLK